MELRYICDPGHGWVEVSMEMVKQLGIQNQISQYSYRRGNMAYLEEDCDAAVFMEACKNQKIQVKLIHVHEEKTAIRNYTRFV